MLKVGSLFSGIGGIELGLERAGFTTEWFVENNPYAAAVLRKNYPKTIIYGDITKIDFNTVPKIDVLTGGFPCQDISNAGKRAGITGSRSSLWKYYAEAIRVLRPKYIIAENVSALINRGLDVVLADLASLGYDAEWHCIPASSVGARHRRDRIFIIAHTTCWGNNGQQCKKSFGETRRNNDVADTRCQQNNEKRGAGECRRNTVGWCEQAAQQENRATSNDSSGGCSSAQTDATNTDLQGLERQHESKQECREPEENGRWGTNWETESGVCRTTDGVPNRVERIKCLGNAVVPQVAQTIGEAINEKASHI